VVAGLSTRKILELISGVIGMWIAIEFAYSFVSELSVIARRGGIDAARKASRIPQAILNVLAKNA